METKTYNRSLSESSKDWLKSSTGLKRLTQSWRSSLFHLKKLGYFDQQPSAYQDLKKDGFIVGMSILSDEKYEFSEVVDRAGNQEYSGTEHWEIVFYAFFYSKNSSIDYFNALSKEALECLVEHIWKDISREKMICKDDNVSTPLFYEELEKISTKGRLFKWEDPAHHHLDNGNVKTSSSFNIQVLENTKDLIQICGCNFPELATIIREFNPSPQDIPNASPKKGLLTSSWEEQLTSYLLSEGFIVSLQPQVLFPQSESSSYREPDLMVFYRGRTIAIEIDDISHLTHIKDNPKKNIRKGQVNITRWESDRILDRLFLCNGIPVLRVWYTDVRDNPEKVMTQVLQIFESLGGNRMQYQ